MPTIFDLNSHKYVTIISIEECEGTDWALRIVALEERVGEKPTSEQLAEEPNPVLREILEKSRSIEATAECATYEICFTNYVTYSVLNESYTCLNTEVGEQTEGGPIAFVCSESSLLQRTRDRTSASNDWPGPLTHYCLWTSDHVVDVVTDTEPQVRVLEGGHEVA